MTYRKGGPSNLNSYFLSIFSESIGHRKANDYISIGIERNKVNQLRKYNKSANPFIRESISYLRITLILSQDWLNFF